MPINHFCGCGEEAGTDFLVIPEECRLDLPVYVDMESYTGDLTLVEIHRALQWAFDEWGNYIHVRAYLTRAPQQAFATVKWESFEGNVLATSNTAKGTCELGQHSQAYSLDVPWTVQTLGLVALHEFGHLLGLRHLGESGHIMSAGLDFNLTGLTHTDVKAALNVGYQQKTPFEPQKPTDGEIVEALRNLIRMLEA